MNFEEVLSSLKDEDCVPHKAAFSRKKLGKYEVGDYPDTGGHTGFWAVYIPGSDPEAEPYTVVVERDKTMECSCKGFFYSQGCKHVTQLKSMLKK